MKFRLGKAANEGFDVGHSLSLVGEWGDAESGEGARVFDFTRSETIMPVIARRATWSAGVFPAAGRAGRGRDA